MDLAGVLARVSAGAFAVARAVRREFRRLSRDLPPGELLHQARRILADTDPILARTLQDSLLAAWLAAAQPVAVEAVDAPEATEAETLRGPLDLATVPLPRELAPPPAGGERPATSFGDPEPVIRFPKIETAARDLLTRRVVNRWEFDRLAADARASASTVSRVVVSDTLDKLGEALAESVTNGGTYRDFYATADGIFAETGDAPLAAHHLENVFRTNIMRAYAVGQDAILAHPLVRDEFPYVEYSATHDSRTRPEHLAMERHGLQGTAIYRTDDPIWELFRPPWSYNCRCILRPVTLEEAARRGIREAIAWLETGEPPVVRAWVELPPFSPPEEWSRPRRLEPVI